MHVNLKNAYRGNLRWLVENTIFCTVHGSHAYGTNIEGSDVDAKGVCIPPRKYFTGFKNKFEQAEQSEPDMVIYDIRKFFELAGNCNPNIIEVLFTDPEHWVKVTPLGEKLYNCRDLFLSMKAKHTFSGYAHAQLKRIKGHKEWLLNPPTHQPTREEFGLNDQQKVSASVRGAFDKLAGDGHKFDKEIMRLLTTEKRYHAALTHWKQYHNWKNSRNEKRAATEAKFGYDTKHAMHLVRLMRMGEEILTTGKVVVKRPDAEELLSIRAGAWSYEKLVDYAENMDAKLTELYDAGQSPLQHKPDWTALDVLCRELVEEFKRWRKG